MWEAIQKSFQMIEARIVTRVDGAGFTVYRVGEIIRIDIKES